MSGGVANFCGRIVGARWFENAILGLIVLGAVVVGLETSRPLMERWGAVLHAIDRLVVLAFAVEALLKMASHGRHFWRYFRDPWNVFDFAIVVVCLLPMHAQFAAVLRLARVLRTLRLISTLPRLQLLVTALLKSAPSMVYVALLLGLHFYVYGVLGVFLWRDNDPVHFRDLPTALLTLFQVVTLEGWASVMYVQMYGSDVYPYVNTTSLPVQPSASPIGGAIYFVSFVLLGTMIMLNLFIGVIINGMSEAQASLARRAHSAKDRLVQDLEEIEAKLKDVRESLKAN